MYKNYEPYIKYNKKRYSIKGKERKEYEAKHIPELSYYEIYRKDLKDAIRESDKKITASAWKKELASIDEQLERTFEPYAQTVSRLAYVEVLEHNRKDLERLLANERNAREKNRNKNRNNQSKD